MNGRAAIWMTALAVGAAAILAAAVTGAQGAAVKSGVSAYAFVVPPEVSMQTDPVLVKQRSSGFAKVTNPRLGLYCLDPTGNLDPATLSWTVSVEYARSGGMVAVAEPDIGNGCPATTFGVRTLKFAPSPAPHWDPAWDVAFMVVVP